MYGLSLKRTLVAFCGALTTSAISVGATISPSQANAIQALGAARG